MELFTKTKAVKLRSHLGKYLVADDDQETVRQSRSGGASRKARWLVELVDNKSHVVRLKSCRGLYLTASNEAFLLGMTGNKVIQTVADNLKEFMEWEPIRDGFQVKLKAFGGTFLRANGGTPPWRNSITHDSPYTGSTQRWILWDVLPVDVSESDDLTDYLEMVSSFSSVSDEISSLDTESPASAHSVNSPWLSINKKRSPLVVKNKAAMDLFTNAMAVRLRSHHDKYLTADEDEETVTQDRNGSSKNARWFVELVDNTDNIIRLKSCYNRYLTASNRPFLLGMTGRKALQTSPKRLDSSVEWEPITEGNLVKLKTRHGQFLRANGGLPPWRNSVTHDIPHRTATQDWILWDVDLVEIIVRSPVPKPPPPLVVHSDSFTSDFSSAATQYSHQSPAYSRQKSGDSLISAPPKLVDGRTIYFHVADEHGNVDEAFEELRIMFKGNDVEELTRKLEEDLGLDGILVCSRSPLNGKLYPLRLQLPPNNVNMHVVVIPSSSGVASDF